MRLISHLGISGEWPPQIQETDGARALLAHCRDVVVEAAVTSSLDTPPRHRIVISTVFEGKNYTRSLFVQDKVFASSFCALLNKQKGKTIEEIGNIEKDPE